MFRPLSLVRPLPSHWNLSPNSASFPLVYSVSRRFRIPLTRSFSASHLPLDGIRVLDLTRILAGPFCTQLLGDFGADVIKIEEPNDGDGSRSWVPPALASSRGVSESVYFMCCNRNKRSLGLNIASASGQAIIRSLVAKCDILVENYLPGKLKEYSLDFNSLIKENPKLIYLSITGNGDFPNPQPGYDLMASARGGLMNITGDSAGPAKVGVAITDLSTGLWSVSAILAALHRVSRTGRGQYITNSLLESQVSLLANIGANYLLANKESVRWGTAHESIVPYQAFADCNKKFFIFGALNNKQFSNLCRAINQPELAADERYLTNSDRVKNRDSLVALLQSVIRTRSAADWIALFESMEIPCAPINSMSEVFSDPQVIARNCISTVIHPTAGPMKLVNPPMKFYEKSDDFTADEREKLPAHPNVADRLTLTCPQTHHFRAPPMLNEHSVEVLKELLGSSDQQIEEWQKQGIIGIFK